MKPDVESLICPAEFLSVGPSSAAAISHEVAVTAVSAQPILMSEVGVTDAVVAQFVDIPAAAEQPIDVSEIAARSVDVPPPV